MRKLVNVFNKSALAAGLLGLAVSGVASADMKFYAGAGLDYAKFGLSKEAKDSVGRARGEVKSKGMGLLIPILGVKFNENFGLETGYSFNKKITIKVLNGEADFKVRNFYVDAMGFMPVMDQVELLGGLGIGKVMLKKGKNIDNAEKLKNSFGFRVKAGAQYNFTNNFGTRVLLTYQTASSKYKDSSEKIVKDMKSIGVAATYTF
jgi:opacity protein-like surface antigen